MSAEHSHEHETNDGDTRRLTFFGGKGGVGKTTLAAAFATLLAERNDTESV